FLNFKLHEKSALSAERSLKKITKRLPEIPCPAPNADKITFMAKKFSAYNVRHIENDELPTWEIVISFVVWISNIVYAFYNVYYASLIFKNRLYGGDFEPGWSILGHIRKDSTDIEWKHFTNRLYKLVFCFVIHSASYKGLDYASPSETAKIVVSVVDLGLLVVIHGYYAIFIQVIHGLVVYLICIKLIRREIATWLFAGLVFYCLSAHWYGKYGTNDFEYYDFQVLLSYKLLQFVSFASYTCKNGDQTFLAFFHYCCYFPYSTVLIVNYKDYKEQIENRLKSPINYRKCIFLALRLIFWVSFLDFLLHFFYVHSLMPSAEILRKVNLPTLCSIGYITGQIFHMKYVCIFGLNSLFAFLDGMQPPWPPICISRVAFYANMWRYFDRGLYSFLLNHIFIPLSNKFRGNLEFLRQFSAAAICFSFIWLWHGAESNLFCWSIMNFVQIILEKFGKLFAKNNQVFIETHITKIWCLRFESMWSVRNQLDNLTKPLYKFQIIPKKLFLRSSMFILTFQVAQKRAMSTLSV
uniref:Protein-cysteine N-palmitoyltransferase Rasp n=1 Tax=Romanomermis culicivorax TaxID=13658 RepID=A0A915KPS3_ROMCU